MARTKRNLSPEEVERRRLAMQELNRKRASGELVPSRERWKRALMALGVDEALADEVAKLATRPIAELDPEPPKGPHGRANPERRAWLARQRRRREIGSWSRQELIEHVEDAVASKLLEPDGEPVEPVVGVPHREEPTNPALLMDHDPVPASARPTEAWRKLGSAPEPEPEPDHDPDDGPFGIDWHELMAEGEALAREHEGKPVPMDVPLDELDPPHMRVFRSHLTPEHMSPYQPTDKYVG